MLHPPLQGEGRPPCFVGAALVAVPSAVAGAHEGRPYGFPPSHNTSDAPYAGDDPRDRRDNSDSRLDARPYSSYIPRITLPCRTSAGDPGWRSVSGSRGRGFVTSAPGRLRVDTPGRHDDRSAGNIARCTGTAGSG